MPMDRSKYPPNWDEIALSVKESANWTCQQCGRPCRKPGVHWALFVAWLLDEGMMDWFYETCDEVGDRVVERPQRFTLTVAHLNHDPSDCSPDNLRAWCSGCHLRYDAKHHARNARRTRDRKSGQLSLLEVI